MTDPLHALRTLLLADAVLASHVGTRIHGLALPKAEADDMPRKNVVLRMAGGLGVGSRGFAKIHTVRIDVFNYGATPFESAEVWRASHDAMKTIDRQVYNSTLLHSADQAGGPVWLTDPDGDWPVTVESWMLLASETTMT